jgi:CheY-like chemotaxis protein
VTQPLALLLYEKLLPGTQLVNRLQDLGYRVQTLDAPALLSQTAMVERPIIVLTDLVFRHGGVCEAISELMQSPATNHIPVLAFAGEKDVAIQEKAREAGARLVVNEAALVQHLPQFLERTLALE